MESLGGNFGRKGERSEKGRERVKEEVKEKRGKEKRENGEEKKGNCKRGGKLKMKGEGYENELRTFFLSFFFFFCLSLFETTEMCLGCTKMEISTGKKIGKWAIF